MASRNEIMAKYTIKDAQTQGSSVLSPVQNLASYNKIPLELARKLAPKSKPLPTPAFAQPTIKAPATPVAIQTSTPKTSKINTLDVLKDAGGLFVDVVRAIPEVRKQGTAAQTGLLQTFSGLEATLGQLATQVGNRENVHMKSSTVVRDKVKSYLRDVGSRLETASENDYKLAEVLGETLPKFSFESKDERHKAIAAGIVQNAPNLLGGVLVGAATLPAGPEASTVALLSYSAALEGGFAFRDAKAMGASDEQARKIMTKVGIANGLLETLPISRFLNRTQGAREIKKQILREVANNIWKTGLEEATTEGLQEMVTNYAMKEVDKNRSLFANVPESAFFGGLLGGGVGVAGGVVTGADKSTGGKLRLGMSIEDVSTPEDKLKEEAKKYKSAEEFVKAQTKDTYIHGTTKPINGDLQLKSKALGVAEPEANAVDALFVTPSDETGVMHSRMYTKQDGVTYSIKLKPEAKIFDYTNPQHRKMLDGRLTEVQQSLIERYLIDGQLYWAATPPPKLIKSLGFDGMKSIERKAGDDAFDETFGNAKYKTNAESIAIFNKDAFTQVETLTKSQLTDIWNEANETETVESFDGINKTLEKQTPAIREIRKATEIEKAPFVKKRESTLLKERIRTLARGYREGIKLGKDTVASVQTELIDLIEESGMGAEDRAGFMRTIRNIQTDEQLQKALPDLQERIDRVTEKTAKKQIRTEILKVSKRAVDSPSVSLEYKEKIKQSIADFEFKGHSKETLQRLEATKAFIEKQIAEGKDVEIPSRLMKNLDILNRTPFEEISLNVLQSVLNDIKFLEQLGRTKFRVKQEVYEYEKANILDELKQSVPLERAEVARPKAGERLTRSQKFRNYITEIMNGANRIDKVISPMDVVLDTMDGATGRYDGPNYRNIKLRFDRDFNAYLYQKYAVQDPVTELAETYKLDETNYTRMGLVAAREQSGGVQKLMNNGYTQEEIDAVVLTKEEREVLELMKKQMDTQFPMIQQVQKDVYNLDVKKVDNYFSFMTDWDVMNEAEVYLRFGPDVAEFGKNIQDVGDRVKSNIDPSFVKKREGAGKQKIDINAMRVFLKHTDNTAYFLNFARDTKMIGEIVRSPEYRDVAGDLGQLLMLEYVDLMSRQGGAAGANQIATLDWLRKNIGVGILGFKLSTVAIQWTSIIDGMGFVGPQYTVIGMNEFLLNKEMRDFVLTFPELRERVGGETVIAELKDGNWFEKLQEKGFVPLQMMDMVSAGSIVTGAYMQKVHAKGKTVDYTNIDKEALEYAQLALRRTQASSSFKDVPLAVSRGSLTGNRSLDRVIFQFQNFVLFRWSRIRHDAIRVGIAQKDPKAAAGVLFWIMLASFAAAGTRMGVQNLMAMLAGDEPDEEKQGLPYAAKSALKEIVSTIPFMGNIMGSYMYDSAFMPIMDTPQNVVQGAKKMFTGVKPETKAKGFIDFSTSIGALLGLPGAMQAQQLLKGFIPTEKKKPEDIMSKYKKKSSSGKTRQQILDKYK